MGKSSKLITITCTVLSLLLIGLAIFLVARESVSATTTTEPEILIGTASPYDFQISPERPSNVTDLEKFSQSRDVSLTINQVTLDRYTIYNTEKGQVLALHFTPAKDGINLRKVTMGLLLRGRQFGRLMMTASGSLAALLKTPGDDLIRQEPFTIWVTFESVDLDLLAELNGEEWAREALDTYIEVYLSDEPGITFSPDGRTVFTDDVTKKIERISPFLPIDDIQPFRRDQ